MSTCAVKGCEGMLASSHCCGGCLALQIVTHRRFSHIDQLSARLITFGIALLSFAAGSLITARLAHMSQVRADSNRVFELRVYHTVPGKAGALQTEFRDKVSKMFARHDLKAVGYWAPVDAPVSDNTFVYILAHPSRDEAKQHWPPFRPIPNSRR